MVHVLKAVYIFCEHHTDLMSLPYFPLSVMTADSSCLERLVSYISSRST